MRTLVLTICFFIPSFSFGQMTLDERFSTDACICLDSLKSHGLNEQNFTDCFEQALQQDSMLLLEEAKKKYGDTSYEVGYKLGRELAERISVSLIYTCETYYNLMDTLRYSELRNLNKDSLEKTIEVLNKTDPNKRDIDFTLKEVLLTFS